MITIFAGGTGGAKLARGFAALLPPGKLTVVANTGDDWSFYGLRVSPDVDMIIYTLAGMLNQTQGWGLSGDTSKVADELRRFGETVWFNLGDRDLAVQLLRNVWYEKGGKPTGFVGWLGDTLKINARVLPMTDDRVETMIVTEKGERHFEEYLLEDKGKGTIQRIRFKGIEAARPSEAVLRMLSLSKMIVLGPSNPFVSIGPILGLPGICEALKENKGLKIAVSPIVGGKAIKGPLARMMLDLGMEVSPFSVAHLYRNLIDYFVLDSSDAQHRQRIEELGVKVLLMDTMMPNPEKEIIFANNFLQSLLNGVC